MSDAKDFDAILISIHAPHEGERRRSVCWRLFMPLFQSTLPTRGSDLEQQYGKAAGEQFQSTLPTRGSDATMGITKTATSISIHAPHEGERRFCRCYCSTQHSYFNPRSPRGGATASSNIIFCNLSISIHAPHEGERRRKSAFVCSISANLLNIIHCGTVTRAVSRRRIAFFRLFFGAKKRCFYVRLCFALKNKGVRG